MKDNVLRGKLLELLRKVYPEGVDQKTVNTILFQYHKIDDISASLEYLVDKGYAVKKEHPHPFLKQEKLLWYKLSPNGIDLLDGNIKDDPGILIPRG
jgi:hypothetical protein